MTKSYAKGDDCEIVCPAGPGLRVRVYPPVGGALCSRCGRRADDIAFLVEGADRAELSGGFCGPCLVPLLRTAVGADAG
jgi:hypothetical protein